MRIINWILGIVFLIIITGVISVKIGSVLFERDTDREIKNLYNNVKGKKAEVFIEKDIEGLPQPVKRWLRYSNVIGKTKISTVRLKQSGLMKTEMGQKGMPTKAEQYFSVENPGFIWKARVKMAPFLFFRGRDKYFKGKGNMLIKLMGLYPVVDGKGKSFNQGTLLRFLGEIVWFPTAAVSEYINWEEIEEKTARETMNYGEITASAKFIINSKGEVVKYICQRFKGDSNSKETYKALLSNYKEFNGIKIPVTGEAVWELEQGDFSYYKFELTDIEYNTAEIY